MSEQQPSRRARSLRRLTVAVLLLLAIGAALIWGYLEGRGEAAREAQRDAPIKAPLRVSSGTENPVLTLDPATLQRNGIETGSPPPASFQQHVRAYATVLDLTKLTDLNNSYANAKAQLQTAQARLAASKAAFKRAENLYRDQQNISQAQLQAAQATFYEDEASLEAAKSQLRTLAATAQQAWGPVLGKSITDDTQTITRLIARQDFLLQVTLPSGVSLPSPPKTAAIETGKNSRAAITFVSAATRTDPEIQGISFFYIAPGASDVLPGMNLLAFLPSGPVVPGVNVPPGAIVWWQDRAWVYRRIGTDRFTRTEVPTDLPTPGGGFIVKASALPKTATIVTQGAQLLLSEEFRAQIQLGKD